MYHVLPILFGYFVVLMIAEEFLERRMISHEQSKQHSRLLLIYTMFAVWVTRYIESLHE
jgi:hypothetical protein